MQQTDMPNDIVVINHFTEDHIGQLHQLYQGEWWCRTRTLLETKQCVAGSQVCIGLTTRDDQLVGFARVLTDYIFKAFIFDVIIASEERNKGLGDQLLFLVKHHPDLRKVRHFELYCLPGMSPFYQRHGFSTDTGDIKLMRYQPDNPSAD